MAAGRPESARHGLGVERGCRLPRAYRGRCESEGVACWGGTSVIVWGGWWGLPTMSRLMGVPARFMSGESVQLRNGDTPPVTGLPG